MSESSEYPTIAVIHYGYQTYRVFVGKRSGLYDLEIMRDGNWVAVNYGPDFRPSDLLQIVGPHIWPTPRG